MSKAKILCLLTLPLLLASCITHRVSFREIRPSVSSTKQARELIAVIDAPTREKSVRISSAMAGLANKWMAQTGDMLVQMSNTEFPAMFERYSLVEVAPSSPPGPGQLLVELSVVEYAFRDFTATVNVSARAQGPGGAELFSKTYTGIGRAQGGKVFWGGAFAMESAIRQSTHSAYVSIFTALAADLNRPAAP